MKLLFVAVFNETSTNISQVNAFEQIGIDVIRYDYRDRYRKIGLERDVELLQIVKTQQPDIVLFAKVNGISHNIMNMCKRLGSKIIYWFPDPLGTLNTNKIGYIDKIKVSDFNICAKYSVYNETKKYTKSYHIIEGYDSNIDKLYNVNKDINVSFIGTIYGNRKHILNEIDAKIFSNTYKEEHAKIVSRSKININLCTGNDASDRVYKILAANGFLLTNDWIGRENEFRDREDLVICNNIQDFKDNIQYYLENEDERNWIADNGNGTNEQYSRIEWAKKIMEIL